MDNNVKKVIVVGGGLVGSLFANFMAKRGYEVTVYEYREDIRLAKLAQGRSINLSLSHRGRSALSAVGLEDTVLQTAIPMKGRLLHSQDGQTKSVPYDKRTNQCIYSIERKYLNELLLTALEKYPNVKIKFHHKLINANLEESSVTLLNTTNNQTVISKADLIVGADGAFSSLRRVIQQTPMFEFSQNYIEHGYLELSIPPKKGTEMVPNHLHIWPRGQFMMIALPNQDKSWTVTLFMPFSKFDLLNTPEKLLTFFKETFPDSVPLLGENHLIEMTFAKKPSPLVSIKCNPYHVGKKFLLVGDAAHAMVPFYGQGMNAGFEDCLIFDEILGRNRESLEDTLVEFSLIRNKDAQAICDLALYNYVEMRDLVTRKSYFFRKTIDDLLFKIFPEKWIPLYNSVTFSRMKYSECVENRKWQDKVLQRLIWSLTLLASISVPYFCVHSYLIL